MSEAIGRSADYRPDLPAVPQRMRVQRNPGVALVWTTRDYWIRKLREGFLFRLGEPTETLWFAEGRPATRAEIMASLSSGLPLLAEVAKEGGPEELKLLDRSYTAALRLVPQ